ncbi:uncharacterized protein LOC121384084 isoform X2 [Gigantopelta aegis]|uniref:uncharacterized protein LOC121384084 isoform X2 n=1 Tax=Gigantopelta aegis TaxID=1735272 RepID=UPI001B88A7FF|nr:uncharacterized protein LOC121384084 isoform X2 [Gigantopelta aegis]
MADSGGKDEKNTAGDTTIIGVQLLSESTKEPVVSLGILIVDNGRLANGSVTVADLRTLICQQIPAVPNQFMFLTHQKWAINKTQEEHVQICQIISPDNTIYIQRKYEKPKIGVRTKSRIPVGFVFEEYTANLSQLRTAINTGIKFFKGITDRYQFLDANSWPISKQHEGQVTVMEVLVDACVCVCADVFSFEYLDVADSDFHVDVNPRKRIKRLKELSFSDIDKDHGWLGYDEASNCCSSCDVTGSAKQLLISYARADAAEHALNLKEELSHLGFSVFLDVHEIKSGVDWQDSLNYAVSNCEVFIPLITPRYGETQWTNREVKLADVLGKYILPVSFLEIWPPRSLAIQFATTQYICWKTPAQIQTEIVEGNSSKANDINCWEKRYVQKVAQDIALCLRRLKSDAVNRIPSLSRRKTLMRTFAGKLPDGVMSVDSSDDDDSKKKILICVHPSQADFVQDFGTWLEGEGFSVWSSLQKEDDCPDYPSRSQDLLPDSQDTSVEPNNNSVCSDQGHCCQQQFQEMADQAGLVIVILSQAFSRSKTCQQQVFYCEHRKRVIPVKFEDFCMPGWMSMLIGTSTFEDVNQTNYRQTLLSKIHRALDPAGKDCFQDEVNEVKLTHAVNHIKRSVGETLCVYIAGGTKFYESNSEAVCRCVGKELATLDNVTIVTGGFSGVGETVSQIFFEETQDNKKPRVWHILPEKDCQNRPNQWNQNSDGTFKVVSFGKTLFCGESVRERETIVGRTFDICILIEGGPGAAHEAEEFVWNDHIVIPIRSTGGAAGGKFGVPEKIFEVPQGVKESDWCILSKTTASAEEIGQSVLRIVQSLKQKMCIEESKSTPTKQKSVMRKGSLLFTKTSPKNTTTKPGLTSMKTIMLG